jgi:cleavage and polyadenylation specificity factor subunit 3
MSAVDVKHTNIHELTLEWTTTASNDMIADSTLGVIVGIDSSPASIKCTFHLVPLFVHILADVLSQ